MREKPWDGSERRQSYIDFAELSRQVVVLGQKLDHLTETKNDTHESILEMMNRHNETLYGNGRPGMTTVVSGLGDTFKIHSVWDRSMFTVVITVILFILGKMILNG